MDAQRLHRLGKRLIELSRQHVKLDADERAIGASTEGLLLEDVLLHPDSTISNIVERTGFSQGHVSARVARLADQGLLSTLPDAADRRRTLVRATPTLQRAIDRRHRVPREVFTETLADPGTADRVLALLDELADLLLPAGSDGP
ncbi:MarR family winged helix-turn-helix transcriptional regulator [Nocardia sp. alder85J]|uniref:MarR family winged helix-turn-helix transcriptional regulator n=1 Tax=Nocardia sp. alder85J TaxID=2862949 RepID=UPI001CD66F8E|nr:MarR family winged helix-turn-helix transcriptional regulator [Nocardia sp. alder85J]MCX4096741.1 MarR family winged helix-turn-helix transcriptional regulator [Nocardia sp. alder85J]